MANEAKLRLKKGAAQKIRGARDTAKKKGAERRYMVTGRGRNTSPPLWGPRRSPAPPASPASLGLVQAHDWPADEAKLSQRAAQKHQGRNGAGAHQHVKDVLPVGKGARQKGAEGSADGPGAVNDGRDCGQGLGVAHQHVVGALPRGEGGGGLRRLLKFRPSSTQAHDGRINLSGKRSALPAIF